MNNSTVDIHSRNVTLEELQEELRVHSSRLEEVEIVYENTPLMSSVKFENVALVEFLLSVGANIHAKNKVCADILCHVFCFSKISFFETRNGSF